MQPVLRHAERNICSQNIVPKFSSTMGSGFLGLDGLPFSSAVFLWRNVTTVWLAIETNTFHNQDLHPTNRPLPIWTLRSCMASKAACFSCTSLYFAMSASLPKSSK